MGKKITPTILKEGEYKLAEVESLQQTEGVKVLDLYEQQLEELFEIDNPELILAPDFKKKQQVFVAQKQSNNPDVTGNWVYFPWINTLIHTIDEVSYFHLRTNRNKNQIETDAENVTITPGVTTGILLAYMATLNRGDEVLLPDPFFPPYKDLALLLGAVPKLIDTAPSFQLTAKLIKPYITPKTKLLIINSPNNPSGAIYPESELRKIAALAKKHKLLIISDEIYENFSYDVKHFSIGSIYPNTLTLNGFSKGYAMTGWRIGYINGPAEIIKGINELQQYMVFSSSSIGQHAALEAFRYGTEKIAKKYVKKRDHSAEILRQAFPNISGGQGAFYFFLKLPIDITDVGFVNHMAHRGVVVLPGSAFSQHKDYIRISFAAETKNLNKGLELICESINHILQPHNRKLKKT